MYIIGNITECLILQPATTRWSHVYRRPSLEHHQPPEADSYTSLTTTDTSVARPATQITPQSTVMMHCHAVKTAHLVSAYHSFRIWFGIWGRVVPGLKIVGRGF